MISKVRHTETTLNGEPLYIVEAHFKERNIRTGVETITDEINRDFEKSRYGLVFRKGVARTAHRQLAQWCSEQFGLVIKLHKEVDPWKEATPGLNKGIIEIPEDEFSLIEEIDEPEEGTSQEDYASI